jgi:hypothetical protein
MSSPDLMERPSGCPWCGSADFDWRHVEETDTMRFACVCGEVFYQCCSEEDLL